MANTFTLIEAKTLASAVSSVTFSSIPQTYTDLKVVFSPRSSVSAVADNMVLKLNTNTISSIKHLGGNGSTASSNNSEFMVVPGATATASTFGNTEIYIPNYTSSNNESVSVDSVSENNATAAYAFLDAGLYTVASAITSLEITANGANFVQYSTFYLYGIKNS